MEHPKHVWDSTEPDRKRIEDEKKAHRPAADPVDLPEQRVKPETPTE